MFEPRLFVLAVNRPLVRSPLVKIVMKKVFNWSELHLSEVTSYTIHTLALVQILVLGVFKIVYGWTLDQTTTIQPFKYPKIHHAKGCKN